MNLLDLKPTKVDPSLRGKNFLFYGEPGTRKTTIASKFPSPVFMQTEDGTKFIDGVYGVQIKNWNEALQFRRELKSEEVKKMYATVVFDRIDTLYSYCYDYVLNKLDIESPQDLGFGQAWTAIKKEWEKFVGSIEAEGYGLVFICHDKPLLDNKMVQIGTKIRLENVAASVVRGLTDFIFNVVKEDGTVYAYSDRPNVETKSRAPYLAKKFEFTFENLTKELANAVEKERKIDGITLEVKKKILVEKRPFEDIRNSVMEKVKNLMATKSPYLEDVGSLIHNKIPDYKISEAPAIYYSQMLLIETYLLSLES